MAASISDIRAAPLVGAGAWGLRAGLGAVGGGFLATGGGPGAEGAWAGGAVGATVDRRVWSERLGGGGLALDEPPDDVEFVGDGDTTDGGRKCDGTSRLWGGVATASGGGGGSGDGGPAW